MHNDKMGTYIKYNFLSPPYYSNDAIKFYKINIKKLESPENRGSKIHLHIGPFMSSFGIVYIYIYKLTTKQI